MEIVVKAHLVHSLNDIESFNISVNDLNQIIIRKRMIYEYSKIVNILKDLSDQEVIHSIFIPKNKKIQKELDTLVLTKKEIKRSLQKIRDAFN